MRNLLNFFLKYNYWFLFVLLEVISFALLFRFNSYQGSAFFTSANRVAGAVYDAANNVTGYFHLKTINDELVQKNVELELQVERLREALTEATGDSSGIEQMKQEALQGYDIFKASVINNSITHADNYHICFKKGISLVGSIIISKTEINCHWLSHSQCLPHQIINPLYQLRSPGKGVLSGNSHFHNQQITFTGNSLIHPI